MPIDVVVASGLDVFCTRSGPLDVVTGAGMDVSLGDGGLMGVTGPAGPTGVGLPGPPGSTGPAGQSAFAAATAAGFEGDLTAWLAAMVGPQGPVGGAGAKGEPGDVGPRGLQGPQGVAGDVGAHGPKGDPGATGPRGDAGPQGVVGPQGGIGPQGEVGPVGAAGAKGDAGVAGPKGDAGTQGVAGAAGAAGPKGDQGVAGVQGVAGPQGLAGPSGSTLGAVFVPSTPLAVFMLDDPASLTGSGGSTFANLRGGVSNACYQLGAGVMTGGAPLVQGDAGATCALFTKGGRPVIEAAVAGADSTGGTALTLVATVLPWHSRKAGGAAHLQHVCGKRATDTISAGYALGVYWTGAKLVAAALFQGAAQAATLLVIGSTDLSNFRSWHLTLAKGAAKTASSCTLYVNGVAERSTVLSDALGSDTCANAGNFSIGGLGGSRTGTNDASDTNTGLNGAVCGVAAYAATLARSQVAALFNATAPGLVQPRSVAAAPVPLLIYTDFTSDDDDASALLVALGLHKRGLCAIKGIVVTQGGGYSAPFVQAVITAAQEAAIPVAAYQGASRAYAGGWEQTACAAFGITATRLTGAFLDPLTLGRTVLAQTAGVQIVEIGPAQETSALLNSPPDAISPSTGAQLVAATGRPLVIMGGHAGANSAEFNFAHAPAETANVFNAWPVPAGQALSIVCSPYETSTAVWVPGNPDVQVARAGIVNGASGNAAATTATYDPGAVLYAVLGLLDRTGAPNGFALTNVGQRNAVDPSTGANTWGGSGTHAMLTFASGGAPLVQATLHGFIAEAMMAMRA